MGEERGYLHMACGNQRRVWAAMMLELHVVMSHLIWMGSGNQHTNSVGVIYILGH